jgi:hypothetical protein
LGGRFGELLLGSCNPYFILSDEFSSLPFVSCVSAAASVPAFAGVPGLPAVACSLLLLASLLFSMSPLLLAYLLLPIPGVDGIPALTDIPAIACTVSKDPYVVGIPTACVPVFSTAAAVHPHVFDVLVTVGSLPGVPDLLCLSLTLLPFPLAISGILLFWLT